MRVQIHERVYLVILIFDWICHHEVFLMFCLAGFCFLLVLSAGLCSVNLARLSNQTSCEKSSPCLRLERLLAGTRTGMGTVFTPKNPFSVYTHKVLFVSRELVWVDRERAIFKNSMPFPLFFFIQYETLISVLLFLKPFHSHVSSRPHIYSFL